MQAETLTVAVALLTYKDTDGRTRTARRGDRIELEGAALEKARRLDAVIDGDLEELPGPVADPATPGAENGGVSDVEDLDPERPSNGASKTAWVAYAVALGMDPDEADKLTRDQLVERHPAE